MANQRLSELRLGQRATIESFSTLDTHHRRKLMAYGLLPGTVVDLLQVRPNYVVKIGHIELAVDYEVASKIYVSKNK